VNDDSTNQTTDADEDEVLLAELRAVVNRVDPVPAEMLAAARSSFMWRTIDAELAQLAHDSVVDEQSALVRGVAAPALLTFEASELTVEVETVSAQGGWQLHGQLVPAQPGLVEIRQPDGVTSVAADDMGRFTADGLRPGPLSLRCRAGDAAVATDWFLA
jgi:hypothetical protein